MRPPPRRWPPYAALVLTVVLLAVGAASWFTLGDLRALAPWLLAWALLTCLLETWFRWRLYRLLRGAETCGACGRRWLHLKAIGFCLGCGASA